IGYWVYLKSMQARKVESIIQVLKNNDTKDCLAVEAVYCEIVSEIFPVIGKNTGKSHLSPESGRQNPAVSPYSS
ncbi:MAG: hypothetical protein ABFS45_10310, partial [Pseudomonadota bacterium]